MQSPETATSWRNLAVRHFLEDSLDSCADQRNARHMQHDMQLERQKGKARVLVFVSRNEAGRILHVSMTLLATRATLSATTTECACAGASPHDNRQDCDGVCSKHLASCLEVCGERSASSSSSSARDGQIQGSLHMALYAGISPEAQASSPVQ
jgi:hypothetical protein